MINYVYGLMDRESKRFIRFVVASEKKVAKAYFARTMSVYRHELKELYKIVELGDIDDKGVFHD